MLARGIAVFIRTSYFDQQNRYEQGCQRNLRTGTNDTCYLQKEAANILENIFKPGFAYAKAGVMLYDLMPQRCQQGSLIAMPEAAPKRMELMAALDKINGKHGRGCLRFGAEGLKDQVWKMKQNNLSPRFTTEWGEIAPAYCK